MTDFVETIKGFYIDDRWNVVIETDKGEEEIYPLVGWGLIEEEREDGTKFDVLSGVWMEDESSDLSFIRDWLADLPKGYKFLAYRRKQFNQHKE